MNAELNEEDQAENCRPITDGDVTARVILFQKSTDG